MTTLADRIEGLDDVNWETIPNVRKAGRYVLFGICGWSVGVVGGISAQFLGLPESLAKSLAMPIFFVVFMALREMSKQWDAVLQQKSAALRARAG